MSGPAFTVIIPAFNARDLVPFAIRSVIAQTRRDWQLIVVDDGSTDDTSSAVTSFAEADSRIRLIRRPNEGPGPARNAAIAAAETPYISFLDADDMWLPGYLDAMGAALDRDPGAGIACTDAWILDLASGRFRVKTAMEKWSAPPAIPEDPTAMMVLLLERNFLWASATVRRKALDRVGAFNPQIRVAEDLELWLRILADGFGVVRAGGVLGIRREHAGALTARELDMLDGLLSVMRLVTSNPEMPGEVRELAERKAIELDRWRLVVSGQRRGRAILLGAYRRAGALRRRVSDRRRFRTQAPEEVRAAFPELTRAV
jgi:glycosyltransferase involved in cell wall biosynthesis